MIRCARFLVFENLLRVLIHRGKKDGSFRPDLNDFAMASALLGATEAMIRDRLMSRGDFSDEELRAIFFAMLDGFAPARPSRVPGPESR